MARGNGIIVSSEPRGKFDEGYLATGLSAKPGTVLQKDPTVALKGGRHTYKLYDRAADGDRPAGPLCVLTHGGAHYLTGKTATDALPTAGRIEVYTPVAGEELNLLMGDVSGTADDHAAGELMMVDDGTGKLVAATGSPQSTPFVLLEAVTDPVADQLVWVQYSGH